MSVGHSATVGRAVDPGAVLDRARALLGAEAAEEVRQVPTAHPRSAEQVASLMRVAGESGWRVRPTGAALDPRWASHPKPDLAISSAGLADEFDHAPVDLNVRVGSGMPIGDLAERVDAGGQWLALDPPGGPAVTMGGVVGTGLAGPLRVLYGRPRDQVLGLTLVDGSGRVLSLGGRVVKNVAGFDLVRLATGSRGTVGMIIDATFRLYPKPEDDRALVWCHDDADAAWRTGRALATLPLPVAAAELLVGDWPDPIPGAAARTVVRLTGSRATNGRIVEVMGEAVAPPDHTVSGDASVALFDAISAEDGRGAAPFRLRMLPNAGRPTIVELTDSCDRLALHLLEGTIRGTFAGEPDPARWLRLRDDVEMAGGALRLLRDPTERDDGALARLASSIRGVFDPAGILS